MKRYIILIIVYTGLLTFFAYNITHSFFTAVSSSINNTYTVSANFPTATLIPSILQDIIPTPTIGPTLTGTQVAVGDVVINEVYYDICSSTITCGTEPQNEWVELYNKTGQPIVLTGWTIEENQHAALTIPAGTTISAGGFLILTPDTQTFTFWPGVDVSKRVVIGINFGNGLANTGDQIILKNNTSVVIDSMSWGNDVTQLNPSAIDVAEGHSLERNPDGVDTNTNADFVDRNPPTPGS